MGAFAEGTGSSGQSSSPSRSRRRNSSRSSSSAMKKRIWSAMSSRKPLCRGKRRLVLGELEEPGDVLLGKPELLLQGLEELDLGGRHLGVRGHDRGGQPEGQHPRSLVRQ